MLIKKLIETRKADAELTPEIRAALIESLFAPVVSLVVGAIGCSIIGAAVGNMMATIIATQMARNNGAPIPIVGIIAVAASTVSACHTSSAQAAAASMSNPPRMRLRSRGSG
jgi:hypothetical protein